MIDVDKSKQDIEFIHKKLFDLEITPTLDDIYLFIEQVGKLANDGMSDEQAREMAFAAIYGV